VIGVLLAGVPVVANSLRAFGVYNLSKDQQQALRDAGQWGAISAVGLFASDAGLRAARCYADAQVQAASLTPAPSPAQDELAGATVGPPVAGGAGGEGLVDDEEGALLEELDAGLLPTDAEEFGEGDEPQSGVTPDDPDAV
jgi:hypothetical protein